LAKLKKSVDSSSLYLSVSAKRFVTRKSVTHVPGWRKVFLPMSRRFEPPEPLTPLMATTLAPPGAEPLTPAE